MVNWVAVLCNIVTILIIGQFINRVYNGEKLNLNGNNLVEAMINFKVWGNISLLSGIIIIAILLFVRYLCNILYAKFSNAASANARVTLRELIYKKLLKLGTGYTSVESTSAVVQVSVEGIEQLEIYFGKYLSQFFYALLVPITLFAFMSFISFKAALVFILCVPLILVSIITIMKIKLQEKKLDSTYFRVLFELAKKESPEALQNLCDPICQFLILEHKLYISFTMFRYGPCIPGSICVCSYVAQD